MQTVVIWDDVHSRIRFAVLDGDYGHLDGAYINDGGDPDKLDELSKLMVGNTGFLDVFPVDAVMAGAKVIVAGFLP